MTGKLEQLKTSDKCDDIHSTPWLNKFSWVISFLTRLETQREEVILSCLNGKHRKL